MGIERAGSDTGLTHAEWDAIRRLLRSGPMLPDQLRIEKLSGPGRGPGGLPFGSTIFDKASKLRSTLDDARRHALKAVASQADPQQSRLVASRLKDHFESLTLFSSVALATLVARTLREETKGIYARVRDDAKTGRIDDITRLTRSWNALGRSLAPEKALTMLLEALGHARELFDGLEELSRTGPVGRSELHLADPPTFQEIHRELPP